MEGKSIFPDFQKNWIPDLESFGLKPPPGANKKKELAKSVQPFWRR